MLLSPAQKALGYKWVFKVKYYVHNSIEKYKTRLVAQGFSQVNRIDYTKTFAQMVRRKLLRIFLAIAVILKMILI